MSSDIRKIGPEEFPGLLNKIDDPPKVLYIRGTLPPKETLFLCFVGSRKAGEYGRKVSSKIIEGLNGYPVAIVSGLALGIDSFCHRAALDCGVPTVAIPGSGLDRKVIYPRSHQSLAEEIVRSGGALLSEFPPDFKATKWSFPQRNRIMAGISHGVLVIEAELRSGSLITARLGLEYNREVCAVPGSIFSSGSSGVNHLIQQGAYPVTSAKDICELFDLKKKEKTEKSFNRNLSDTEKKILELVSSPLKKNELIERSEMPASKVNIAISSLQLKGLISETEGVIYPERD